VADDKGHTVSSTTSVTVVAPPPPPVPHTQTICSLSFEKDTRRPTRVDNEAKACLDEISLNLQNQADSKAVLVGYANAKEKAITEKQQAYAAKHKKAKVTDYAAQRAVNAKNYLVTEKGIDGSRISLATGTDDAQKVNDYLVPSGATFGSDIQGTTPVDESTLKPEVRKPLPQRHR
jgi:ribosomal protein S11